MAERYPLAWPIGWKRTSPNLRQRSAARSYRRDLSVWDGIARLEAQLRLLGATDAQLSTNAPLRLDGRPRSDVQVADPGAAVYFKLKTQDRCLACDRWHRLPDNIDAIAKHIGALRTIDRYGVGTLDQAFAGYAALPPSHEDWWLVLGVRADADPGAVKDAYRSLLMAHHPDRGGDSELMAKINRAYETYEATR